MSEKATTLTPHEAAAAAAISVRDMHRAIDEGIVSGAFTEVHNGERRFDPTASVLMAYYVGLADKVTAKERRRVIEASAPYVTATLDPSCRAVRDRSGLATSEPSEQMDTHLVTLIAHVRDRLKRIEAARAAVTSSDGVLNGTPVIHGTRIPVHYVAATYETEGLDGVRAAYPDLDDDTIELAKLYADTHPLRGGPPGRTVPSGATMRTTWRARHATTRAGA
mgnify:CR=1 FL=1